MCEQEACRRWRYLVYLLQILKVVPVTDSSCNSLHTQEAHMLMHYTAVAEENLCIPLISPVCCHNCYTKPRGHGQCPVSEHSSSQMLE